MSAMALAFVSALPSALQRKNRFPVTKRRPSSHNNVLMVQAEKKPADAKETKRQVRRRILKSDKYHRMGFKETKEAASADMQSKYFSDVMDEFKQNNNMIQRGDITFKLAESYGFCWGVDRAIALAFQACLKYPGRRIWLTNELIHNPHVNQQLRERNVHIVPQEGTKKDLSGITSEDVVILPAFGAALEDMDYLNATAFAVVDTTCPWVSKVWNALDKHSNISATSIIHGKYYHEETVATKSFGETYLIVLNLDEAKYVCDYILRGGDRAEFMEKFKNQMSVGFNPDTDLQAVGVANQTTMLKSETTAIGKLFQVTMMEKYGPENINKHFIVADTICDATQERQDAMEKLLGEEMDFMLVFGGFNSSNTSHLQEMAEVRNVTSYWIDSPKRILPGNKVYARSAQGEERVHENWLPKGPVTIGVTSGASSPDSQVADAINLISLIHEDL